MLLPFALLQSSASTGFAKHIVTIDIVKVTLRLTVSQSVSLEAHDQIFITV
jgi:hypothetical protein